MKYIAGIVFLICFAQCNDKLDDITVSTYKDYVALQTGKSITYRLDSTVLNSFGQQFIVRSYQVKDSIVEKFLDNQGRESYKLYRYMRPLSGGSWAPTNTFYYTHGDNKLEYVENNLRYIVMTNPVADGYQWSGNSYITQSPYYPAHNFNNWKFFYKDVKVAKSFGALSFANTVTVVRADSTLYVPPAKKFRADYFDKSYDVFAAGVGLVYREDLVWQYQPTIGYSNNDTCLYLRPKTSGGFDTLKVRCNEVRYNCDSLMRIPGHKVVCDTIVRSYYYEGYGTRLTITGYN